MFKDLALSKDLTKEFQASLSGGKPGASVALSGDQVLDGLSVMVLQYSSWPLQKVESKLALPGPVTITFSYVLFHLLIRLANLDGPGADAVQ